MRPLALIILLAGTAWAGLPTSTSYPPSDLWKPVSPVFAVRKQNQPIVVDRNLLTAGNGVHELWDISQPSRPRSLSVLTSPHHDGEAESHQVTVARTWEGRTRLATISGLGVDLWDITTPELPELLAAVPLEGIDYGDNTEAVWGLQWVGGVLYAGGTSTGLHVVDVSDPTTPAVITRLPTQALGGVLAGPLWAVGRLLVVTTPKEFAGIATLDLSDPRDPVVVDSVVEAERSYIGGFFGRHAHLLTPLRVYDVTSERGLITPVSSTTTPDAEYVSYGDDALFMGALRPEPGVMKWSLADPTAPALLGKVDGRKDGRDLGFFTDDQFSMPIGNLLVMCDDELTWGCQLAVHDTRADTHPPELVWSDPPDGATGVAPTAPVGLSFSDQLDSASVSPDTFVLRALGGQPVPGDWSSQGTVLTFLPRAPLPADTTFEVVLAAGGIADPSGNALADEVALTFATGEALTRIDCAPQGSGRSEVGEAVSLLAPSGDGIGWRWELGDGGSADGAAVEHTWTTPGRFAVRLTGTLGGASRTCLVNHTVHRPLTPASPASSGPIAVDCGRVWAVVDDAASLIEVDRESRAVVSRVEVGGEPFHVAADGEGGAWVSLPHEDRVVRVSGGQVSEEVALPYGCEPRGVAMAGDGLLVVCAGRGELLTVSGGAVVERWPVGAGTRGIAVDAAAGRAWLPRFHSVDGEGIVWEVDLDGGEVAQTSHLPVDPGPDTNFSGRGVPNLLGAATLSPDGRRLVVPGLKSNVGRGLQRDGEILDADNTVRTLIAGIEADEGEVSEARLDLDDHEGTVAAAFSPDGALLFVVSRGSNRVDVHDTFDRHKVAGFSTGLGPDGIVVDDDGLVWVHDALGRSLTVVDAGRVIAGTDALTPPVAVVPLVESEPLAADVLLGKVLFHNASAREISQDGYIACATCHPDGGHDAQTWDFTERGEGLRNTIDLRGRAGTGHGPVHWSANFDEVQDFEHDLRDRFGGAGLMDDALFVGEVADPLGAPKAGLSPRLDALAAYVSTFTTFPRSPHRSDDGDASEEASRGAALFDRLGCADCHAGEAMTDSSSGVRHDVGTITASSGGRLGGTLDGLDTPTLRGLHASAPYLHDGSAATLADVLGNEAHVGRALKARDVVALTAFLLALDGGVPPEASGCGCDSRAGGGWSAAGLAGLLVLRRRSARRS